MVGSQIACALSNRRSPGTHALKSSTAATTSSSSAPKSNSPQQISSTAAPTSSSHEPRSTSSTNSGKSFYAANPDIGRVVRIQFMAKTFYNDLILR